MAAKSAAAAEQERPTPKDGSIVHTEFITSEPKALRTLLEKEFGWKFETMKMDDGQEYHMFTTPGGDSGGVSVPPDPRAPIGTFSYIGVKDIKATAKRVEKAGAKIVMPVTEIPNMGWFFQFQVKGGPVLACFQGA